LISDDETVADQKIKEFSKIKKKKDGSFVDLAQPRKAAEAQRKMMKAMVNTKPSKTPKESSSKVCPSCCIKPCPPPLDCQFDICSVFAEVRENPTKR